jgi:hypothetical protein
MKLKEPRPLLAISAAKVVNAIPRKRELMKRTPRII